MLDLDEPISKMKIIHVAGTKGKVGTLIIIINWFCNNFLSSSLPLLFGCWENWKG